jgi:hypothetical protein
MLVPSNAIRSFHLAREHHGHTPYVGVYRGTFNRPPHSVLVTLPLYLAQHSGFVKGYPGGAHRSLSYLRHGAPTNEQIAANPDVADERERPTFFLMAARR